MKKVLIAVALVLCTGCTTLTTAQRKSLIADMNTVIRGNRQANEQLTEIIRVKDLDIKKFAPSYAQVYQHSTDKLNKTLNVSDEATKIANGYLLDIERGASILERSKYTLGVR